MTKLPVAHLDGVRAPKPAFWENELELGLEHNLAWFASGGVSRWLKRLSGRQVTVLRQVLGLPERARDRLAGIPGQPHALVPYYLVTRMAAYKSRVAVAEYVSGVLDEEVLSRCRESENHYDVPAAMLALYDDSWDHLPKVFQLHKVHGTGFARMKLTQRLRKTAAGAMRKFLTSSRLKRSLSAYDAGRHDGLESELKGVIPRDKRDLVFIRRAKRPNYVVRHKKALHGYSPEWIILDFFDEAKRVRIGATSIGIPLELANRIATDHFGAKCEYENESTFTPPALLQTFLKALRYERDDQLTLVEIALLNSPIKSSPKLRMSSHGQASVAPAVKDLEAKYGEVFLQPENIDSVKVLYAKKRVSVILEPEGANYVVRYSDQRLNGTEREKFENHIRKRHGIKVTSTEKQYAKS